MHQEFQEVRVPISKDNVCIQRDETLCIKCGACKKVCRDMQTIDGYYDYNLCEEPNCVGCGQCIMVCPTQALHERYEIEQVKNALKDKDKIVIVSTAPAVRVAFGDFFKQQAGKDDEGALISALRALGFDYVFDVTFGADMTICEEASELMQRLQNNSHLPQFTSCCPSWVKFVETYYPEYKDNLSTTRSPIGIQGATIKSYFAKQKGIDPESIVNVVITPCTSKKYEVRRQEMNKAGTLIGKPHIKDMDYVLTIRELVTLLKQEKINYKKLESGKCDQLLDRGSGGGIIFGTTGGVMESALRTVNKYLTGNNRDDLLCFSQVRGLDGVKEAEVKVLDKTIKVAVVHGLKNARALLDSIKSGQSHYDFVEVMSCRGGCVGGGGQPFGVNDTILQKRAEGLYKKDDSSTKRVSVDNPDVIKAYADYYGKSLSPLAEELLHTTFVDRSGDIGGKTDISPEKLDNKKRYKCRVCNYIAEFDEDMPDDFVCPICGMTKDFFDKY